MKLLKKFKTIKAIVNASQEELKSELGKKAEIPVAELGGKIEIQNMS